MQRTQIFKLLDYSKLSIINILLVASTYFYPRPINQPKS